MSLIFNMRQSQYLQLTGITIAFKSFIKKAEEDRRVEHDFDRIRECAT